MRGYESRVAVPDELTSWGVPYDGYQPPVFTDEVVVTKGREQGWADPEDISTIDFSQRQSYVGPIQFNNEGYPLNPMGRTGMAGRGKLGKWGPNHAADSMVFAPSPVNNSELDILLVTRGDTGALALPGGMGEPGEKVSLTARRELEEEAGIQIDADQLRKVFSGYVNDPRNTDNAWMETVAAYTILDKPVSPTAGDDATHAEWYPVPAVLERPLYASHADLIRSALRKIGRL